MKKIVSALFVMMLAFSGNAWAEFKPGSITITPSLGGYVFEGNQNTDQGLAIGAALGYVFTKNLGAELTFDYINAESDAGKGTVNGYLYKLDGLYYFRNFGKLMPYVAAGLGGLTLDESRGATHSSFILNYGGGVQYFLTDNIALRGDIRHVVALGEENNNFMYTAGVTFYLGRKPALARQAKVETPPPAPVEEAPKVEAPPPPPVKKETKTEAPAAPAMIKKEVCIDIKVEFDFNKANIRPRYHYELKRIADCIKQYPNNKAVIEGHTDGRGDAAYNMKLSQRRADAIRRYLIDKFGVNPNQLSAKGYGKTRPIANNATDEGRQRNRRVELHLKAEKIEKP